MFTAKQNWKTVQCSEPVQSHNKKNHVSANLEKKAKRMRSVWRHRPHRFVRIRINASIRRMCTVLSDSESVIGQCEVYGASAHASTNRLQNSDNNTTHFSFVECCCCRYFFSLHFSLDAVSSVRCDCCFEHETHIAH